MVNGVRKQGSPQDYRLDEMALETAHELADEALSRFGAIMDAPLKEEEKEQEIEKLLNELNKRGNEMYQQKRKNVLNNKQPTHSGSLQ